MKRKITLAILCFWGITVFSACSKIKDIIEQEDGGEGSVNTLGMLGISSGDGIFVGVRSYSVQSTPIGDMEVIIGTAVAAVGDLKTGAFLEAGEVKCYVGSSPTAYTLTRQPNKSYVFTPTATNYQGIPFQDGTAGMPFWEVNELGISKGSYYRFPRKPELLSSTEITRGTDNEVRFRSNDGHELLVIISSGNQYVYKRLKSSDAEYINQRVTFSASDLNRLPASDQALIQVVPFTIHTSSVSGKEYYFINETVLTKSANLK